MLHKIPKPARKMVPLLVCLVILVECLPFAAFATPTNTTFNTATTLTSQVGDQLTISGLTSGQSQWFRVSVTAGQWVYPCIYGIAAGEDWDLGLYSYTNTQISNSAHFGNAIEYNGYTATYTGYMYFKVQAYSVAGSSSSCHFKVVVSNGTSGTSSTNSNYDRVDAKDYMDRYWDDRNPVYPDFPSGDCANYVSQTLRYGGMAMAGDTPTRDAMTSWFCHTPYNPSEQTNGYSATWAGANQFTTYWGTNSMGTGTKKAYECKYYIGQHIVDDFATIKASLHVGDVIQYTHAGATDRYHTLLVYEITNNIVYLSCHSSNSIYVSLLDRAQRNPTQIFVIMRIKSGS